MGFLTQPADTRQDFYAFQTSLKIGFLLKNHSDFEKFLFAFCLIFLKMEFNSGFARFTEYRMST